LLLAGHLQSELTLTNPTQQVLYLRRTSIGTLIGASNVRVPTATLDYRNEFDAYSIEGQHIFAGPKQSLILGARFQSGEFDTLSQLGAAGRVQLGDINATSPPAFDTQPTTTDDVTDFQRANAYAYYLWRVVEPLQVTVGLAYDHLRYPENFRSPPTSGAERVVDQFSPKAGLIWTPDRRTTLRSAYARSLGGVSYDQSFQLEPSQVAGFNQAYRSLIPESVVGPLTAAPMETMGFSWEQKFGTGTYWSAQVEWLRSDAARFVGVNDIFFGAGTLRYGNSTTPQRLDYEERNLTLTLNQLVGRRWSLGASYRLSDADLRTDFVDISDLILRGARTHSAATLHQLVLFAGFQHENGFFGQAESIWRAQDNQADLAGLRDADFWQFNLYAGYRFPRRRAELRLGLLNLTDRDYHLHPLNLTAEVPRERMLFVSFKFNF
jgi:hypothetical protein